MKTNKSVMILAASSILIIIVATLFHYPIHIENAITNSLVPEFGISISLWRIIFEPFVGLLLFC